MDGFEKKQDRTIQQTVEANRSLKVLCRKLQTVQIQTIKLRNKHREILNLHKKF